MLYVPKEGEFPKTCEAKLGQGGVCRAALGKHVKLHGRYIYRPLKTFEYQSVDDWLGWMLSRPHLENLMASSARLSSVKDKARDIWDCQAIQDIVFNDRYKFKNSPESDLRLAFSIGIDWFKVFPGGEARKAWSIGAIYLVCMNLPPAMRYRHENICLLGIIPGPKKPSTAQLNHFLEPIVKQLLPYWETGVKFSRTFLHSGGCKVWAVLLLVICDLDAARGIAGFSHYTHNYFCSYCYTTLNHIGNFDTKSWTFRKRCDHRVQAEKWRTASAEEKEEIYKTHGVRYSKLLDLSYFDPLRSVVLDVMHNMLLGNLKRHCMKVWGMDTQVEGGDGAMPLASLSATEEEIARGQLVLRTGMDEKGKQIKLEELSVGVLQRLCIEKCIFQHVARKRVKAPLCQALNDWVSSSRV